MRALILLACLPLGAFAQDRSETRELLGQMGGRAALMVLQASARAEGGFLVTGEYLLLPTMVRRFLEGERSPEIGVTTLKEGSTPILFGRPPSGELRGTWRGTRFTGTRYGPGGQERERFDLSEEFPQMDAYSATVRCEAADTRYSYSLAYSTEAGRIRSFDWRSRVAPSEHSCAIAALEQQPMKGGLRAASGACSVTLRDLGEFVRVAAENCSLACGSQGYLEPVLVDRRGHCRMLRPEGR